MKKNHLINYRLTLIILFVFTVSSIYGQCPAAGSTLFANQTINSDCTISGDLAVQATLTIDPGVTLNVTGTLTIRGDAIISASATSNIIIGGDLRDEWTGGGANTISGGDYTIAGNVIEASGGSFNIDNATISADSLYTSGGANLRILNGSQVTITKGMRNEESLTIDASTLDLGGVLDATGGDLITVRNNGELIIRGDYQMNNGGGVQMVIETGGLVRVFGNVDSTTGGNTINVDGGSGITVDGDFTGTPRPDVELDGLDCDPSVACCGGADACGDVTILPVTLLSFTGIINDQSVLLNWSTASELNNDFFTIEKSFDGVNFEQIGNMGGVGTADHVSEYTYYDVLGTSTSSFVYYRLSQTDFDGTHEKLKVILLSSGKTHDVKFYPNPVVSGEPLLIEGLPANLNWTLYSLAGEPILQGPLGNQLLETSGFTSGAYILQLEGELFEIRKLLIVR